LILLGTLWTVNFRYVSQIDAAEPGFPIANSPFGTPIGDGVTGISTTVQSSNALQFSLLPKESVRLAFGEQSVRPELSLPGAAPQRTGGFLMDRADLPSPDLAVRSARGDGSGMQTSESKRGVRKGMLAVTRVVAFDETNNGANGLKSLTNCTVCGYGHTGGEILIPTSAIATGLGHIFGFHRAR
jgi:hypothetical protein